LSIRRFIVLKVLAVDDEKMIARLADMAVKGDNPDLRQRALRLLKETFTAQDRRMQSIFIFLFYF
jgi:hypothetical protein